MDGPPRLIVMRLTELVLLFGGIPVAAAWWMGRIAEGPWILMAALPMAVAVTAAFVCLIVLWIDPTFDLRQLGRGRAKVGDLRGVLALAGGVTLGMTAAVAILKPAWLFWLPRHRPDLFAVFLVAYPLLSVYPQELVYRAFFFHRYRPIFGAGPVMIAANAVAFGYMHILFRNPLAVLLAIAGGVIFAWRYDRSRSLLLVTFEHALYGVMLFTVGLGQFFYSGLPMLTGP